MANSYLCLVGPGKIDQEIMETVGLPYERLAVGGVHGMAPWRALPNLARFVLAVPRVMATLRRFRPDVVLLGGGYVCAPVAVAARLLRVPTVTLCVDVVPGWAARLSARLSTRVASAFPSALALLPRDRTTVTGYPVREEFLHTDHLAARRRFGLPDTARVIVVFGGSSGARAINRATAGALDRLLPVAFVIHITGRNTDSPRRHGDTEDRYLPFEYLEAEDMAAALAAADLAVCRAGAAAMAELPAVGTPAVLIPGEFSAQERNARSMAADGAAVMILDRELTAGRLADVVLALLNAPDRLAAMAAACRSLARPQAVDDVAALIREVAHA